LTARTSASTLRGLAVRLALGSALVLVALFGGGAAEPGDGSVAGIPGGRLRGAREAVAVPAHPTLGFGRGVFGVSRQGALARQHVRLPDFATYDDVQRRREDFFAWMLPLVDAENARLLDVRRRLTFVFEHMRWGRPLAVEDRRWLGELAVEFRIQDDPESPAFWRTAFERVDVLPDDLVVVQAANESAWGTSRFAREGNNLFGLWCFRPGCGLVPQDRPDGASYEVARFANPAESVGSYMRNLNTGASYQQLRQLRSAGRAVGRLPGAEDLAEGLVDYSERGEEYVHDIQAMLRWNRPYIEAARASRILDVDGEG